MHSMKIKGPLSNTSPLKTSLNTLAVGLKQRIAHVCLFNTRNHTHVP